MSSMSTVVKTAAGATARGFRDLLPRHDDLLAVKRHPRRDLLAGVTVAIIALPLALGYGVASGLGAAAGLTTAIVAGAIAAIFGGSNLQVSGPTGAMTVVLAPMVAAYGVGGVLTACVMAGVILVVVAATGIARYVRLIPAPVVEGFTAGIAAIIFVQQIPVMLGIPAPADQKVLAGAWQSIRSFSAAPQWTGVCIAAAVAGVTLLGAHWRPKIPFSLLTIIGATIVVELTPVTAAEIGSLPATLAAPSFAFLELSAIPSLAWSAVTIAGICALESLLSATVADRMRGKGERHDPNRELFGQGLSNLFAPLFGGMPASAAISRTAVNVRAGAGSRLAAFTHAAGLAVIAIAAAPLVAHIPLAALAGVLVATAIRMLELGVLRTFGKVSRADGIIMLVTAVLTLAHDLLAAIAIGVGVAGISAIRQIAAATRAERVGHAGDIATFRLDGPLFFAVTHRLLHTFTDPHGFSAVVFRCAKVSTIDSSGALLLRDVIETLESAGKHVHLAGVREDHQRALTAVGVLPRLAATGRVHPHTPAALAAARAQLAAAA